MLFDKLLMKSDQAIFGKFAEKYLEEIFDII